MVHVAKPNLIRTDCWILNVGNRKRDIDWEREREAGREAEKVSFREIKLISLSVCSGWYFIYQWGLRCCDPPTPHPNTITTTTSTVMSVSGRPRHSPAGDNRLNLFHFMPQAPKYNPCGAPPGPAAPLCPPSGPPALGRKLAAAAPVHWAKPLRWRPARLQAIWGNYCVCMCACVCPRMCMWWFLYVCIIGLCQLRWSMCCI